MRIALIGYGKMGHMIEDIALKRGHQIACIIDIDNREDFKGNAFKSADVAIEFTTPTAAYGNILQAFEQNVKVVTGSTGWQKEHGDDIRRLCQQEGHTLFWSSNFSLGVYLFNQVSAYLARLMNNYPDYDVEIDEVHHIHKLDAPSGTAITLAETLIQNLDRKKDWVKGELHTPDGIISGQRDIKKEDLVINSFRRGEVPGIHTIKYNSAFDEISITHDAHNRGGFALGAVLAAEFAANHEGLLTMDDLFKQPTR